MAQFPVHRVLVAFLPGVKWQECEADLSHPSCGENKKVHHMDSCIETEKPSVFHFGSIVLQQMLTNYIGQSPF